MVVVENAVANSFSAGMAAEFERPPAHWVLSQQHQGREIQRRIAGVGEQPSNAAQGIVMFVICASVAF